MAALVISMMEVSSVSSPSDRRSWSKLRWLEVNRASTLPSLAIQNGGMGRGVLTVCASFAVLGGGYGIRDAGGYTPFMYE